ncbi:MAG TPA: hypothetical protein VKO42_04085 [Patescibacteria group bacterium]|nr:hypothetical protein [Patescibacteria group bacterium]
MEIKQIFIKRYVEEGFDDNDYKGYVEIDSLRFDYRFRFGFPVTNIVTADPALFAEKLRKSYSWDHIRQLCRISLMKNGKIVHLNDEEYKFFLRIILEMAFNLYTMKKTQRIKNSIRRNSNLKGRDFTAPEFTHLDEATIFYFPIDLFRMLNRSKFGHLLTS